MPHEEQDSREDSRSKRSRVTRRQFLDGVAISGSGLAVAAAFPWMTGAQAASAGRAAGGLPPGYYPPRSTGITGEPDDVIREIVKIDGLPDPINIHSAVGGPGISRKTSNIKENDYDCVIVGGGVSGLAAAKSYRDRFGPQSKILIIDPLPDFGGHAHRNEFHVSG